MTQKLTYQTMPQKRDEKKNSKPLNSSESEIEKSHTRLLQGHISRSIWIYAISQILLIPQKLLDIQFWIKN